MRLISAHIRGYGRLVDTKINLDAKVIAVVGPNEAGKTTLLNALTHVDHQGAVPLSQRSRAVEVSDDTPVTEFSYALDDDDRLALDNLDLHEPPKMATISRSASGESLIVSITPEPLKSISPLSTAITRLTAMSTSDDLDRWIYAKVADSDPEDAPDYRRELATVIESVQGSINEPGTALTDEAAEATESLLSAAAEDPDAISLHNALTAVLDWNNQEDPGVEARTCIWKRSPDFILFSEADRSLQSAYTFNDELFADMPPALANLAGTADLDLTELLRFVRSGDIARSRTAITRANRRMDAIFKDAWNQSQLSVHFDLDGTLLRVLLWADDDSITLFDERSAGLRMFVALIAFLSVHGTERPSILLIDEAENHLHIDAQADLVTMFVTQEHAEKVIYTTHSPACLPPDLGSGIRTIVPQSEDPQVSDVKNSFWQGKAGFSPLMLAMGAAAAAFTPARYVVLAEGATEMILLPTLLRKATSETELPYQVAPGLSEIPNKLLPNLDLEAARVAYLVDGDNGGTKLREALIKAGVPENLIAKLGALALENVLKPDLYREAITALLPECNPKVAANSIPEVPMLEPSNAVPWATTTTAWIRTQKLLAPSKIAVANWLVENQKAIPSADGAEVLNELHKNLIAALRFNKTTTTR